MHTNHCDHSHLPLQHAADILQCNTVTREEVCKFVMPDYAQLEQARRDRDGW